MKQQKHKKVTKYKQIKKEERNEISILFNKGYSIRDIAKALKRNPGTIYREITRNRRKTKKKGRTVNSSYDAETANHKAYVRRKYSKYQGKKINENKELKEYIIKGLMKHWSPDEISGRMKQEKQLFYASKTNIYEWLYNNYLGYFLCPYLYSKRYKVKSRKDKTKRTLIPNRRGIELRPDEANTDYGHYEGDTIVSGKKHHSKACLAVIYEKKAKHVNARKIKSLKPLVFNESVKSIFNELDKSKSLTLDNGIENVKHEELDIDTYFCDPYSSWQKGGVENVNKAIRRFIPKGSNINNYSDKYIADVIDILNNKPRKSLNYKTPLEVMIENGLLKNKKTSINHLLENAEKDKINIKKLMYPGVALGG